MRTTDTDDDDILFPGPPPSGSTFQGGGVSAAAGPSFDPFTGELLPTTPPPSPPADQTPWNDKTQGSHPHDPGGEALKELKASIQKVQNTIDALAARSTPQPSDISPVTSMVAPLAQKLEDCAVLLAARSSDLARQAQEVERQGSGKMRAWLVTGAAALLSCIVGIGAGYALAPAPASSGSVGGSADTAEVRAMLAAVTAAGNRLEWLFNCPKERQIKERPGQYCILNTTQPFKVPEAKP